MFFVDKVMAAAEKFCDDIEALGKDTERTAVALWDGDKTRLTELSDRFAKRAAVGATIIALQEAGVRVAGAVIGDDCVMDKIVENVIEPSFVETALVGTAAVMAAVAKVGSDEQLQEDLKGCAATAVNVSLEVVRRIYNA